MHSAIVEQKQAICSSGFCQEESCESTLKSLVVFSCLGHQNSELSPRLERNMMSCLLDLLWKGKVLTWARGVVPSLRLTPIWRPSHSQASCASVTKEETMKLYRFTYIVFLSLLVACGTYTHSQR